MRMQEEILHSFVTLKCSYSDSFTDVPRRFASVTVGLRCGILGKC